MAVGETVGTEAEGPPGSEEAVGSACPEACLEATAAEGMEARAAEEDSLVVSVLPGSCRLRNAMGTTPFTFRKALQYD